mmetsp:Transcript_71167/g.208592  ORF Transcript_71167/g.208592 Transcript_71167/m.208592 type:complete len:117 (+) Transcript_71167:889-1239(+)
MGCMQPEAFTLQASQPGQTEITAERAESQAPFWPAKRREETNRMRCLQLPDLPLYEQSWSQGELSPAEGQPRLLRLQQKAFFSADQPIFQLLKPALQSKRGWVVCLAPGDCVGQPL